MSGQLPGLAQHALLRRRLHQVESVAPGGFLPSPCVSVCSMDPGSGLCRGCFRTIAEIADWASQSPEGQRGIWQRVAQRMNADPS